MIIEQGSYTCSATGQEVQLSFTGRHRLMELREAIIKALTEGDYEADDRAISKARGKLALYMSSLESQLNWKERRIKPAAPWEKPDLSSVSTVELAAEVARRVGVVL